ncbi:MAG TPA: tetratricopeptide repeat protein [Bryobacteraceae bacterium]|nr:tetratricopeptide repeat protein [Bryobacteraceae bacterium]
MLARPQQSYTRGEVCRLLGVSERQLRVWERQELVPRLDAFAFSDLIALRSLQKLRANRVSPTRIRSAVRALRGKLDGVEDPLKELKIFCEGRKIAVLVEGQKMEPVSGQLLLDFDRAELKTLLAFPSERPSARAGQAARLKEAENWFERGLELEQTGAPPEEIIEAYQKSLELDPSSAGAAVNLGTVYYHLRRWEDAERAYQQAVTIDPEYALAHFNLGNLFDERGETEKAAAHYHAALKLNADYADAHYNLALLSQKQGETLKAVRHWKAYLKLDGSSTWSAVARRELDKLCRATVLPGTRTV